MKNTMLPAVLGLGLIVAWPTLAATQPDNGPAAIDLSWWADPMTSRQYRAATTGVQLFLAAPGENHATLPMAGEPEPGSSYLEMNLSRPAGAMTWHFAGTHAPNQFLSQVGFSAGSVRIDSFGGTGEGVASLRNRYSYLDPFHFHGGSFGPYSFNGFSLIKQFGPVDVQAATVTIDANHLRTRRVHGGGIHWRQHGASVMQVMRDNDTVGEVLSLHTGTGKTRFGLHHMAHDNGARHVAVHLSGSRRGVGYSVSLVDASNPLFDIKNQKRLQFGLRFSTRKLHRGFGVTPDAESEPKPEKQSSANNFLVAGGLLAVGLGLSSGGGGGGGSPDPGDDGGGSDNPGPPDGENPMDPEPMDPEPMDPEPMDPDMAMRFTRQHDAAEQVLNHINPTSVGEHCEYGGWIYRNADGTYSSTGYVRGDVDSVSIPNRLLPSGIAASASYHTHGGDDPGYNSEVFSCGDLVSDRLDNTDGYLGTPEGRFLYNDVSRYSRDDIDPHSEERCAKLFERNIPNIRGEHIRRDGIVITIANVPPPGTVRQCFP